MIFFAGHILNILTDPLNMIGSGTPVGEKGGINDWRVGIGTEPQTPTNCITVYETTGREPLSSMNVRNETVELSGAQVRVRSKTYQSGYNKIREIVALIGDLGATVSLADDVEYSFIRSASSILSLGAQRTGNEPIDTYLFTVNFKTFAKEK